MRTLIRVLISSVLLVSLAVAQNANAPDNTPQAAPKKSPSQAAISPNGAATGWRAIHNSALIFDTHADTPGRFVDENFDLSQDAGSGRNRSGTGGPTAAIQFAVARLRHLFAIYFDGARIASRRSGVPSTLSRCGYRGPPW
ncbi:MAG: hypothetical protein ABSC64_15810 [Candidatus Korobacteraceae bacterium]|jgi:hypothetical protein